jgi:Helix-turn-helix domain
VDHAQHRSTPPRLAYSKAEAAEMLGVSVDFLEDHIWPELRVIRRGRRVFVSAREIDRWLEANATRTLPDGAA